MTGKILTNYRLTDEARAAIETLANRLGVSKTDIVEMAVRKLAISEGLSFPDKKGSNSGVSVKETSLRLFSQ